MFGRGFVEDGIGVVDVEEDFAAAGVGGELREKAIRTGKRDVANLRRGFFAAAGLLQFVVGPEGAVDQNDIGGSGDLRPFRATAGERRSDEDFFAGLFEEQTDGGFVGRGAAAKIFTGKVGIGAVEWNGVVEKGRSVTGIFREMATDASTGREHLPLDRRIGAFEDSEDTAFVLEEALDGGSGKNEKILELTQMKQTHDGIHIGGKKKNSRDRRVSGKVGIGREFRAANDLRAKIGRSANEKPEARNRRESDLRL